MKQEYNDKSKKKLTTSKDFTNIGKERWSDILKKISNGQQNNPKDKVYLREMEILLDKLDNIENEKLKLDIIYQIFKCEKILIKNTQNIIEKNGIKT